MKIGIFSNYNFDYETMKITGSGVYRYKIDLGSKRGGSTDRDLFHLMNDLKTFLQLKNNWNRGRDKDILESMTKIYGLIGICSTFKLDNFTKDFNDDEKIYYVDAEMIDLEYVQREIIAFNLAFEFFREKVGFSDKKATLSDKQHFLKLLEPSKKHITFDMQLDSMGNPTKKLRPNNLLGVAYMELESIFFHNSKIKTCDFHECGKTYTSNRLDNKCCSRECGMAYRRDKSRYRKALKEGKKLTLQNFKEKYPTRIIEEWTKSV